MAVATYVQTVWVSGAAPGMDKAELDNIEDQVFAITEDYNDHVGDTDNFHDHGSTTGRGDDDHTLYSKADGTRAFTGTVAGVTPSGGTDLATKAYIDSAIAALEWEESWTFPETVVEVYTGVRELVARENRTIVAVWASVTTAPTGADIIADLLIDAVTAYTTGANRPTIAGGTKDSTTTLPDVVAWLQGEAITFDILQIGSTIAGSGFRITVVYTKD